MDHHSQVALVLTKETDGDLSGRIPLLTDCALRADVQALLAVEAERLVSPEGGFVLYHWREILWHAQHPAIPWLLRQLLDRDPHAYGLWHLGEDLDDNEWSGLLHETPFELDLHRELVFNRRS